MPARRKLTVALFTTAIVAALACTAVLVIPQLLGWKVQTVLSGSMAPTYSVRSVVIVRPVNPAGIKVGEVINFSASPGTPTTHRVVAINGQAGSLSFVTKGDANDSPDPNPVSPSAIHGRVVFGVPLLGRLVLATHTPARLVLLLLVPALALFVTQFKELRRALRPATSHLPEGSRS